MQQNIQLNIQVFKRHNNKTFNESFSKTCETQKVPTQIGVQDIVQ